VNASSIHHRREPSPNASQYVYMFPTAVHTLRPLCASNQIKLSRALIVVQRRDAEPTDCDFRGRKRWASSAAWVGDRGADPTGHVGLPLGRRDVWRLRPFQLFLATCGSLNGAATRVTRLPCRVSGTQCLQTTAMRPWRDPRAAGIQRQEHRQDGVRRRCFGCSRQRGLV
jgi:hypothetical protein